MTIKRTSPRETVACNFTIHLESFSVHDHKTHDIGRKKIISHILKKFSFEAIKGMFKFTCYTFESLSAPSIDI